MAHSTFHFSLGLAVGTAALLPALLRKMKRRERLSVPVAKWLLVAYGIGLYAIAPNLLRRIGVPDSVCNGWWMNIFMFHQLIDHVKKGGVLIAEVVTLVCFCTQYLLVLTALRHCLRGGHRQPASDQRSG